MINKQLVNLHENSGGYFTIAQNKKCWKQYYFNNINSVSIDLKQKDIYISQNTFNNKSRKLIHLKELKALYIDIDCYNKGLTKEAVKYFLEKDMYGKIPIPNMLIDSGRGLYYVIFLENTEAKELPKWQIVEKYLYEKLKEYGADSKCIEPTRVLRVVGSFNSKVNSEVKIIDTYNYKYTLDEIIENYIPEIKKEQQEKTKPPGARKKGRKPKIVTLFNIYNLYYNRKCDIKILCELRNYNLTGMRENILFLYRFYCNVFYSNDEEALDNVLELNIKFTEPLTEKEVIEATSSAVIGATENRYKYSNDKLIQMLDITPLEQKYLSTIISTREKYDRNNKKRKEKRQKCKECKISEKKELIKNVKELNEKKYTNDMIAKELNIHRNTVLKYLKQ